MSLQILSDKNSEDTFNFPVACDKLNHCLHCAC